MLQPQQVKPFLTHPERVVRNFAFKYFSESFNRDPQLLSLALQDLDSEVQDPDIQYRLMLAERFTLTWETLPELFKRLKSKSDFSEWLERLITNADLDLLTEFSAEKQYLSPEALEYLEQRTEIASRSTAQLWMDLWQYAREWPKEEFDEDYANWLQHELIKRPDLPKDELLARMHAPIPDASDDYETICLCRLLGQLRFAEALPFIIQCLQNDEDELLNEAASQALIKMGSPEVVHTLESLYPAGNDGFKINAIFSLMNIKLPEAEAALLRLFRHETDLDLSTLIASGLCQLLSAEAIPFVHAMLHQGYEQSMLCLEEELYVNCLLNDEHPPEMPQWRLLIATNFERRDNEDFRGWVDEDYDEEAEDDWLDEADDFFAPFKVEQRTVVKIGRNEPCPCGSGKKYKKCCLGSSESK